MNRRRIELCETACRMAWARVGINIKDKETTCPPLAGGPKSLISRRGLIDWIASHSLGYFSSLAPAWERGNTQVFKITTSLCIGCSALCSACFSQNNIFYMSLRTGTKSFIVEIKKLLLVS